MKTIFSTLLLFVLAINTNAQETNPIKKWSFGAELFPNMTSEIISSDGNTNDDSEIYYNSTEIAKFCMSGQVYSSYNFNSKTSLSIGLGYQNTGNKTRETQLTYGDYIDSRRGFIYGDSTSNGDNLIFKYNHHNIQIPVFLNYNFTRKFYVRSGISTIFNFSNTTTSVLRTSDETKRNTDKQTSTDYRTFNFSGNLGIGYSYFKSSNLDLYVQLNYETTFMQLAKNTPINRRPVSVGLIFGAKI